jgi:hypothetical protein
MSIAAPTMISNIPIILFILYCDYADYRIDVTDFIFADYINLDDCTDGMN